MMYVISSEEEMFHLTLNIGTLLSLQRWREFDENKLFCRYHKTASLAFFGVSTFSVVYFHPRHHLQSFPSL